MSSRLQLQICFFFNDTATTEIYTLSLHDALPISAAAEAAPRMLPTGKESGAMGSSRCRVALYSHDTMGRSEEHTSELQSRPHLVCRLLLEKKKNHGYDDTHVLSRLHAARVSTHAD